MAIDLILNLAVQGVSQTQSALDNIEKRIVDIGKKMEDVGKKSEESTGKTDGLTDSLDNASESADEAADSAEDLGEKLDEAGEGARDTGKEVEKLKDNTDEAAKSADDLKTAFKNVRKAGLAISAAGAAGGLLSRRMTEARVEADKLGGLMSTKLNSVGLGDAAGQVREMAHALAMVSGEDPNQIANQLAGVIATGRGFRGLAGKGIVVTDEQRDAIKESDNPQLATLQALAEATAKATDDLGESLTDVQKVTIEQSVRWGELQEQMGEGTAVVRTAIYNNILSPLFSVMETTPGLAKTTGAVLSIGSAGASAAGGILTLTSQLGMTAMAFPGLASSAAGAFSAIAGGAATAAAAILPMITAAAAAAAPFLAIAAAAAAAFWAIDKLLHWKEDKQLKENIAKGDEAETQLLKIQNEKRRKQGKQELTMEQFREGKEPASASAPPAAAVSTLNAAIAGNVQMPTSMAIAAAPAAATVSAMSQSEMIRQAEKGEARRLGLDKQARNENVVTLKPKTDVSRNGNGDFLVRILPEEFVIPNDFARAVRTM